MTFKEAVRSGFENYATFSGRASRSEYWWWVLFGILGNFAANILDAVIFGSSAMPMHGEMEYFVPNVFGGIFGLATFLPGLSVFVRRLHDTGRSGWWFWLILIPLVGFLVLLYWMLKPGDPGPNDYGSGTMPGNNPYNPMPPMPRA